MPFSLLRRGRSQRNSLRRTGSQKGKKRNDPSLEIERLMKQMPPEPELSEKFAEVVDELDLSAAKREGVLALPPEAKWRLYLNQKFKHLTGDDNDVERTSKYISDVKHLTGAPYPPDIREQQSSTKLADNLKTALRTQTQSFVNQFIQANGLDCLLEFLQQMDHSTRQSGIHTAIIGCIKALLNNTYGRGHVLSHMKATSIIAQSLYTDNVKTKVAVYEILGAVCLVPGGHKNVLKAMSHFQHYASERTRFQTVVLDLDHSTGMYREEVNLKTAVMSLLNALLCGGSGEDHLEFRVHLRYEFLMLGFQPVFVKLRGQSNSILDRHLEFFELMRKEDEREIASRFEMPHIDTNSASAMLDVLKRKLAHSPSYPHLLSLLQHCLMVPVEGDYLAHRWKLLDHVVQQIVLQQDGGVDPDLEPLKIDVQDIVHHLFREEEMEKMTAQLEDVKKTKDDLQSKLGKKERECEIRTKEKEDVKKALNKIMTKLEKEQKELREYKLREKELNASVTELKAKLDREMLDRVRLENILEKSSVSLPDDAKAAAGMDAAQLSLRLSGVDVSSQPALPAPPAPLGLACPPPPPPLVPGGPIPPGPPPPPGAPGFGSSKQKKIPKASQPLKSFNWSKLGEHQVKKTLWKDLDDAHVFRLLDLPNFERSFSAYQKKEGSTEDVSQIKAKPKELSVIDGRRAQNCTILLSKLKMSNEELKLVVLSMDDEEEVTVDMVEQILKYVPQQDEVQLLMSHKEEIDKMARADRFLYEMSQINHYEQRMAVLFYKKKFNERVGECRPKVEAIFRASREVARSTRLRRLLEIILALGNYMNRGVRSNAFGFRISSLNNIIDTKSSTDRRMTLLHYLIETVELKFPEVLQLERDLPNVRNGSKVNMTELETEMLALKQGLERVQNELNYHSTQSTRELGDRFVDIVSDFESLASVQLAELEEMLIDSKIQFNKTVELFGEDPMKTQPDDFFGMFATFLQSFDEARQENEVMKKKRQEEARKAREMAEQKEREKRATERRKREQESRSSDSRIKPKGVGKSESGEFDDLINALQKGDVFGEDLAKYRRKHGRRVSGHGDSGKSPKRVVGIPESRERSPAGD